MQINFAGKKLYAIVTFTNTYIQWKKPWPHPALICFATFSSMFPILMASLSIVSKIYGLSYPRLLDGYFFAIFRCQFVLRAHAKSTVKILFDLLYYVLCLFFNFLLHPTTILFSCANHDYCFSLFYFVPVVNILS